MKSQLSLGAMILPLLALPTLAQAESPPGDAQEGYRLARQGCSACHKVEQEERGVSPVGAPAFQDIADDPAVTETALQVFFRMPHENMPDLVLTPAETDNAIAYILGLR
jgi:mono/diheme cytochrome c family protein